MLKYYNLYCNSISQWMLYVKNIPFKFGRYSVVDRREKNIYIIMLYISNYIIDIPYKFKL